MSHFKLAIPKISGSVEEGFNGNKDDIDEGFINTNQYILWNKNTNCGNQIKKGDTVHLIKPKSSKTPKYYIGEVYNRIVDENYTFSTKILGWNWSLIRENPEHRNKKEIKYIIYWQEQPYPRNDLYEKIMKGFNAQTIKKFEI